MLFMAVFKKDFSVLLSGFCTSSQVLNSFINSEREVERGEERVEGVEGGGEGLGVEWGRGERVERRKKREGVCGEKQIELECTC